MRKINIREEFCIGCGLCKVYCQTEHSRSKDMIKALRGRSRVRCHGSELKGTAIPVSPSSATTALSRGVSTHASLEL
jgi:Fe-S-cluster-containing hydrogenase component 2